MSRERRRRKEGRGQGSWGGAREGVMRGRRKGDKEGGTHLTSGVTKLVHGRTSTCMRIVVNCKSKQVSKHLAKQASRQLFD